MGLGISGEDRELFQLAQHGSPTLTLILTLILTLTLILALVLILALKLSLTLRGP